MKRVAVLIGSVPLATLLAAGAALAAPGAAQGPSSSQGPYLVRTSPGIVTESILTTGDAVAGYRMAGSRTVSAPSTTATARSPC